MITRSITYTDPNTEEEVTVSVDLLKSQFVSDIIKTSVGDVPYEWHTEFTATEIDTAIKNYLEGTPNEVTSNGVGFLIEVSGREVEVLEADYTVDYLNFRWLSGSNYKGECAIEFVFSESTTAADIVAAIGGLLPEE
ncbi:hypothetical protein [Pseudohongiella nitratireducens]|uniref:hypothetical protein n=1 Tax=Pseudohongiella nitratireducens TaxID=1768907 RepID=UPI0030EB9882|tara:strand:- start:12 stop:422 length:411 start_codon:yes stop_codon:yes gene_type:complete